MTIREANHRANIQRWANEWRQQESSGLHRQDWCKLHNISYNTFRSHVREIKKYILENSVVEKTLEVLPDVPQPEISSNKLEFAQILVKPVEIEGPAPVTTVATKADIHLEIRGIKIDISNTADEAHMGYILGAILNVR